MIKEIRILIAHANVNIDMFIKFLNIIQENNLIKENDKVIVGLSGGPDSVCLFYLLCKFKEQFKFDLIAAHLDHGWRTTSKQDVIFCRELAEKYKVPFISKHASEVTVKKKLYGSSKEELGRTLRRQFFQDLLKSEQANSIALAHHWDDQIETFFIRLMRGTTIAGLSCMQIKQDPYIRPLINFKKEDILNFVHSEKLAYIIDETNESDKFLRNKIRKYLIPQARNIDTRFDINFEKALDHIQQTNEFISRILENSFQEIVQKTDEGFVLNKEKFLALDSYLHKNLIIMWLCKNNVQFPVSNAFLNEIIKFIKETGSGIHQIHQEWSIIKEKQWLKINRL